MGAKKGGKKGGKGGKKGKKKGKKTKNPIEGLPEEIKTMDLLTLQRSIEEARRVLMDNKIRRNYIQNEKDFIKQFYDNTYKEASDLDAKVTNKDTEMEHLEDNHRVEVKVYMQKIKHLEYDHQNALRKIGVDSSEANKRETNYHTVSENTMKYKKIEIRKQIHERELANVGTVEYLISNYERNIQKMKADYEQHLKQIENRYQEKLQRLQEDLDLRLKVEIHEVEERKNKHRNELMNNHEKAFRDIKKYYNDITRGNLELIRSLKDEKVQLTKNEKENEKLIQELEEQNKVLKSPVEAAKKELADLEAQLTNYKLDKVSLQNAKKFLKNLAHKLDESKYDKRELEGKYRMSVSERDELFHKFEFTINKVREKTEYKNAYLEQNLQTLEDQLLRKETQLQEVLRRADLDPRYFVDISKKIVDSLEAKNTIMKNLQYSLAHATKAYNDAIRVYEAKLVEFGIPAEELGFQPLDGNNSTMPAGLVAA